MKIVQFKNVCKTYGENHVLKGINLVLEQGKTYLLMGHNGSGKTTLVRALLNFIEYEGNITRSFKEIAYIPEKLVFPEMITIEEFLDTIARIARVPLRERRETMRWILTYFELNDHKTKMLSRLSKGMLQKVLIAQAFLKEADMFVLDEAMNGLDPLMQMKWIDLLEKEKKKGKTILITTHYKEHYIGVYDEVIILEQGCIV